MTLTRKMLKAMGVEDEKVEQIIEAHAETVDALKQERDKYKTDAESLSNVAKERDAIKARIEALDTVKTTAETVKAEYDEYKAKVEAEKVAARKQAAAEAALLAEGANPKAVKLMLKDIDLSKMELDDAGKPTNTEAVISPIKTEYADFFGKQQQQGVNTVKPPTGTPPPNYDDMTDEDYYKSTVKKKE